MRIIEKQCYSVSTVLNFHDLKVLVYSLVRL